MLADRWRGYGADHEIGLLTMPRAARTIRFPLSSSSVISRQLAGLEVAMRLTDDVTPFNVVAVLQITGTLPAAALRAALDEWQRRHPLLRTRIVPAGKGYCFHFDVTNPIPLEVVDPAAAGSWIAAAQDALHRRFELTAGPLARCQFLRSESGGELILTMHHTIVDAASATHGIGELLSLCAGQTPDAGADTALEGQRPAADLFPAEYKGLRFVRAVAGFMRRQLADELTFQWNSRGVRKPPIAATGRCCILPMRFSPALTAAVIQASRTQRVTLNAILSAGLMAAVQRRLYPSKRAPLRHIIFADLRPRLTTPVPGSVMGCLLTMFRFTVNVDPDAGFWPLARDLQQSTQLAAQRGERYLSYAMSPGLMKMILGLKAFRMGATALSYSGPTTLPVHYGSFEVTGLHAFAANMTLGPEYSALVRLFRGELWWDILYLDSDMDAAGAEAIAREMQTILEEATC
jgi:hypothetical protein